MPLNILEESVRASHDFLSEMATQLFERIRISFLCVRAKINRPLLDSKMANAWGGLQYLKNQN